MCVCVGVGGGGGEGGEGDRGGMRADESSAGVKYRRVVVWNLFTKMVGMGGG